MSSSRNRTPQIIRFARAFVAFHFMRRYMVHWKGVQSTPFTQICSLAKWSVGDREKSQTGASGKVCFEAALTGGTYGGRPKGGGAAFAMMTTKSYSASQIADFLRAVTPQEDNDLSNLKLQKLCYYAQGLCSAMRGHRLIKDAFEAWDHGPVVPSLYREYKHYGSEVIATIDNFDFAQIENSDQVALRDIFDYYGQYSAWRLRNMTHEERPWIEAYNSKNRIIDINSMVEFFRPQIDSEYVNTVYGKRKVQTAVV